MFSPFFCGSFHHQVEEDDDDIEPCSPYSPTRKSRKFRTCSRSKADSKNPYANRGLDKFSALVADLDDKRQKIYTEVGSQDISFVRFVYSSSNDCKPIVVKMRDRKHDKTSMEKNINNKDKPITATTTHNSEYPIEASTNTVNGVEKSDQRAAKKKSLTWDLKLENWRRPSYYLPVIIVLILFFLAMFGKSFAILCTSIGWYFVPAIKGGNSNAKRPRKKKEYVRKFSENKISTSDGFSSPRSVITENSPRQHGHRKSW